MGGRLRMTHLAHRRRTLIVPRLRRRRFPRVLRYTLAFGTSALLCLLLWPYLVLWEINRATTQEDPAALAPFVDLPAARRAITEKLNKNADSAIGPLSDPFIRWLEAGITADGNDAIAHLVTLRWVRERLLIDATRHEDGFLSDVTYAFFDAPDGFRVRIGRTAENPTQLRLRLRNFRWQVAAIYY
jgi:hypothetical protein